MPDYDIRPVEEEDLPAVLSLLESDPDYFALDGKLPSLDSLRADLSALPPRCIMEQKHYVAFWREGTPEAVLDWVEGLPQGADPVGGLFPGEEELGRARASESGCVRPAWGGL